MVVEGLEAETSRNSPSLTFSITVQETGLAYFLSDRASAPGVTGGQSGTISERLLGLPAKSQSFSPPQLQNIDTVNLDTSNHRSVILPTCSRSFAI
jgi:hypothetical protein